MYVSSLEPRNFRDVGVWLNRIASRKLLGKGLLLRSGSIKAEATRQELGQAATIVSLKGSANAHDWAAHIHAPKPDNGECYNTQERAVRAWLRGIVLELSRPPAATPILIHCHAGRDRTGVVIATILKLLDIPRDVIVEEFLLSDSASRNAIQNALDGLEDPANWIKADDIAALRAVFAKG